ncbi:non-heme bromoperoxidase BpoC [Gordonia spumicola]|uniref:Non-heme bromoperoxidase BpoC n=1 Tax=Gordonia spumicola TaxID=589161 RepID=A0A7I9V4A3_9ACTN|nr:alpha/beta hydrolase [Gordonia spumicola]GEE00259.1 non-heme bromoperoxidase BpoC [Gordonia spumicola]
MSGALVDVGDGIEIWASSTGDGPAVLLSPGLGMPPGSWAFSGLPERLADAGFRVITYAARGVAPSSAPPAPYTVHGMAADAASVLGHFDVDEAILVGYSMGCYVSQALFDVWSGRVVGLAMIGGLRSSVIGEVVNRMELDLIERLGGVPASVSLFEQLMTTLAPSTLRDNAQVGVWRDILASASDVWTSPAGQHGQTAASWAWMSAGEPTLDRLTAIDCPTLVVGFEDDVFFPPSGSREAASHIPDSRWLLVDGEGHGGLMLDPAHRAASHVVDFCTSLATP